MKVHLSRHLSVAAAASKHKNMIVVFVVNVATRYTLLFNGTTTGFHVVGFIAWLGIHGCGGG